MESNIGKSVYAIATLSLITSVLFYSDVRAASTNSGIVSVHEIKADYSRETSNTKLFYYTFVGNLGNDCGRVNYDWAKSGDENINILLRSAYFLGEKIKVGINGNDCVITTVHITHQ